MTAFVYKLDPTAPYDLLRQFRSRDSAVDAGFAEARRRNVLHAEDRPAALRVAELHHFQPLDGADEPSRRLVLAAIGAMAAVLCAELGLHSPRAALETLPGVVAPSFAPLLIGLAAALANGGTPGWAKREDEYEIVWGVDGALPSVGAVKSIAPPAEESAAAP